MKKIMCKIMSFVLLVSLTACSSGNKDTGKFKVVDGQELFFNGQDQIIDRLVSVDGKKYYIGENGTKIKNDWAIIDNEGTYAYFGAQGIMICDTIKEINNQLYMFDKDGRLETNGLTNKNGDIYYATKDGYLLKEQFKIIDEKDNYFGPDGKLRGVASPSWVSNVNINGLGDLASGYYYLNEDGQRVKNTWVDGYYLGDSGLMVTDAWIGTGENRVYVGENGKKENAISSNGENKLVWELKYYLDDFEEKTNEKYVESKFEGKFSDYITDGFKKCDFVFQIDDYVHLQMYKYQLLKVQESDYFSFIYSYRVTLRTIDGYQVSFNASLYNDKIEFDNYGSECMIKQLKKSQKFKLNIKEDSYNPLNGNMHSDVGEYLVEVTSGNFNNLYWK